MKHRARSIAGLAALTALIVAGCGPKADSDVVRTQPEATPAEAELPSRPAVAAERDARTILDTETDTAAAGRWTTTTSRRPGSAPRPAPHDSSWFAGESR